MHDMLKKIIEEKKNLSHVIPTKTVGCVEGSVQNSLGGEDPSTTLRFAQDDKFFSIFKKNSLSIIGELKFASPSAGILGSAKELLSRAKAYEEAGVGAISVITEEYFFHGKPEFVSEVKRIVSIPVLQKDFVIDENQIYEAAELGSDALLLIARIVTEEKLQQFVEKCLELGIEPVVEIASEEDLEKVLTTKTRIIAVNARDLDTFVVDVSKACDLLKKIPDIYIRLGFSGIQTEKEVEQYREAGAKGVLVGTSLMKAENIKGYLSSLRGLKGRGNLNKNYKIASSQALRNDRSIKVKICGVRTLEAAQVAIDAGADFLGFNFMKSSKRYIEPQDVKKILKQVQDDKGIKIVGVFQNMLLAEVQEIIADCNLDYAQFHGDESQEYINQIQIKTIKAFRFAGDFDIDEARKQMQQFKVNYYLVDRIKQSEGPMISREKVAQLAKEFPLFFAGGLTPENVEEVIGTVNPFGVDVASGVETDGEQDVEKIRQFIKNAKEVQYSSSGTK